jgi:spore germination protein KA
MELRELTAQVIDQIDHMLPQGAAYAPDVEGAHATIQAHLGSSPDLVFRRLRVPACQPDPVLVVYIDGLVDPELVDIGIIAPLLKTTQSPRHWADCLFLSGDIRQHQRWPTIFHALTEGHTLVFAPGLSSVFSISATKLPQRSITTPKTERTIRGPDEAFNEVIGVQMSQLRREIQSTQLRFHSITLGRLQHTPVVVAYLHGLTNSALVEAMIQRLEHVSIPRSACHPREKYGIFGPWLARRIPDKPPVNRYV